MRKRHVYSAVLLVVLGLAVLGYLYLFRETTMTAADDLVTMRWRWGRAREMLVDRDHDGVPEERYLYTRWSTEFRSHDVEDEAYVDTTDDGRFDLYAKFEDDVVRRVEHDTDGDGVRETVVTGTEAPAYFRSRAFPETAAVGSAHRNSGPSRTVQA